MKKAPVLEALVRSQGFAVFTHLGGGRFRRIGDSPEWFLKMGGATVARDGTVQLGERFPFVQNFLADAEEVWKAESKESKDSGIWIEKGAAGREVALEVSALWLLGKPILLFRNSQESYREQGRWLQIAREARLAHDLLGREIQKKEILLHCIIHDLSQPLSAMRGCFSSLKLESTPGAARELVETGLKQSHLQESMIREILEAFSEELATQRVSPGKAAGRPDIAAVASEVARDYSAAFVEKGARIKLDRGVDLSREWKVVGDESRLRRIFANLVENSLRLSPPGSTVLVGVIDEDRFVRAFVDDEGPGFTEGQAPISPFSLFGKGKEHGGKAGLGLYSCRITVEQWGGSIGCEQRPKGGARFWFRLPRAERKGGKTVASREVTEQPVGAAGRSQAAVHSSPPSPGTGTDAQGAGRTLEAARRPLRILLAEDAEVNQELMTLMLEKRGHTVVPVKNGREVLMAVENERFDLVLMDHDMPELNGMEATKIIRRKERETGKHMPIVGVTGMALMGGREDCLAAGMDACLPKPFQVDELYETVEGLFFLARAKTRDPEASAGCSAPGKTPLAYLGEDRKFVRKLVRIFLAESSKRLSEIRRAISRRDAAQLASSAHTLGGSVSVFDAKSVAAASRRLEAMGRSADFNGVDAAYSSLMHEFAVLRLQLRRLAPKSAGPNTKARRKRALPMGRKRGKD